MSRDQEAALRHIPSRRSPDVKAAIGADLRARREAKGLTLDAVARQTRIPRSRLEALEEDRLGDFPALVYLRGFLKNYSDFLEADFDALWARVEAATAPPAPEAAPAQDASHAAPGRPVSDPQPPPHGSAPRAVPRAPAAAHGGAEEEGAGAPDAAVAGGIVAAVSLSVLIGVWLAGRRAPTSAESAPEVPRALQPLPRAEPPEVALRLKDDAWLSVSVDGAPAFEGRAPRGVLQKWPARRQLSVRTTAPDSVELLVGGEPRPLPPPGPDGERRLDLP